MQNGNVNGVQPQAASKSAALRWIPFPFTRRHQIATKNCDRWLYNNRFVVSQIVPCQWVHRQAADKQAALSEYPALTPAKPFCRSVTGVTGFHRSIYIISFEFSYDMIEYRITCQPVTTRHRAGTVCRVCRVYHRAIYNT